MLVGEGPGKSEDALGRPFIGKSGQLLRRALDRAGACELAISITNLVLCRPCDRRGGPNRPPSPEEAGNCSGRLASLIEIQQPPVVCTLGRVPESLLWMTEQRLNGPALGFQLFNLPHPAWVEREGGVDSPAYAGYVMQFIEVVNAVYRAKEQTDHAIRGF